ncbi:solute carrier family 13 member 2 [Protopterus annectens]|uniref:solute carrier family 13 member 2 n=1 Tax=Protopterus annectens TaxID=7888 RepID=UPI001CFA6096|nr:solute carrier family 13 member 2 [Protopterus annectens]
MAIYWCMEAIPLAITAFLPVLLFPLLQVLDSGQVCMQYLKDTNMLFVGGLIMAIAVETWNLHRRIALNVLLLVGVKPALLMFGFMVVTAFLSMWISNTAATAMMIPIAEAVLQQLKTTNQLPEDTESETGCDNQGLELEENEESKVDIYQNMNSDKQIHTTACNGFPHNPHENGHIFTIEDNSNMREERQKIKKKQHEDLCKSMSLCICYSASIGGTATLTGTTPNLVLSGQMNELFPDNNNVINFASWFGVAFPNMILMLLLSWLWIQCMYLGWNLKKNFGCGKKKTSKKEEKAYLVIKEEHKKLGPMLFGEIVVLSIFVLLIILWFTRDPGFMPGWAGVLFNKEETFVTDATVALFISVLLFLIPSEIPCCLTRKTETTEDANQGKEGEEKQKKFKAPPALLTWKTVHEKMPWSIVILLGGGFALAHGCEKSGLSGWLGQQLTPLQAIPPAAIVLVLCFMVAVFTECTSNAATTTLFLPILASMARAIEIHPLYVMVPCTLASSLAFMLPVATPPNAIAFSYGHLKVIDMAKCGAILNVAGVFLISLAINTWGYAILGLGTFPSWANATTTP